MPRIERTLPLVAGCGDAAALPKITIRTVGKEVTERLSQSPAQRKELCARTRLFCWSAIFGVETSEVTQQ